MNEIVLKNIYDLLVKDGKVTNSFEEWKKNFERDESVQSNIHTYLTDQKHISNDLTEWQAKIGTAKEYKTELQDGASQHISKDLFQKPPDVSNWEGYEKELVRELDKIYGNDFLIQEAVWWEDAIKITPLKPGSESKVFGYKFLEPMAGGIEGRSLSEQYDNVIAFLEENKPTLENKTEQEIFQKTRIAPNNYPELIIPYKKTILGKTYEVVEGKGMFAKEGQKQATTEDMESMIAITSNEYRRIFETKTLDQFEELRNWHLKPDENKENLNKIHNEVQQELKKKGYNMSDGDFADFIDKGAQTGFFGQMLGKVANERGRTSLAENLQNLDELDPDVEKEILADANNQYQDWEIDKQKIWTKKRAAQKSLSEEIEKGADADEKVINRLQGEIGGYDKDLQKLADEPFFESEKEKRGSAYMDNETMQYRKQQTDKHAADQKINTNNELLQVKKENPGMGDWDAHETLLKAKMLNLQKLYSAGKTETVTLNFDMGEELFSHGSKNMFEVQEFYKRLYEKGLVNKVFPWMVKTDERRRVLSVKDGKISVDIPVYELFDSGYDGRDFTGWADNILMKRMISDDSVNKLNQYEDAVYRTKGQVYALHEMTYVNNDPGAFERGLHGKSGGPAEFVRAGLTATLTHFTDISHEEADKIASFGRGHTNNYMLDQFQKVQQEYNTAVAGKMFKDEAGEEVKVEELHWTPEQMEAFERTFAEEIGEGVGNFVPMLIELGIYSAATGGVLSMPVIAARLAALKATSAWGKLGYHAIMASIEEGKMYLADMGALTGTTFYAGGVATRGITPFKGRWKWMDPIWQKVIKGGAIGATSATTANIANLAYRDLMGDADFEAVFNETYGDLGENAKNWLVEAIVFGIVGAGHVKGVRKDPVTGKLRRGFDLMRTYEKDAAVREIEAAQKEIIDNPEGKGVELFVEAMEKGPTFFEGKPEGYELLGSKQQAKWDALEQGKININRVIAHEDMAIKLDPKNKDFEANFKRMYGNVANAGIRMGLSGEAKKNYKDFEIKWLETKREIETHFDNPKATAEYNPNNNTMYFNKSKYTPGKSVHEFIHAAVNARFKSNPQLQVNFNKKIAKLFEKFDFLTVREGTKLGDFISENYGVVNPKTGKRDGRLKATKDMRGEEFLAYMVEILADPKIYRQNIAPTFFKEAKEELLSIAEESGLYRPKIRNAGQFVRLLGRLSQDARRGLGFEHKASQMANLDKIDFLGIEYSVNRDIKIEKDAVYKESKKSLYIGDREINAVKHGKKLDSYWENNFKGVEKAKREIPFNKSIKENISADFPFSGEIWGPYLDMVISGYNSAIKRKANNWHQYIIPMGEKQNASRSSARNMLHVEMLSGERGVLDVIKKYRGVDVKEGVITQAFSKNLHEKLRLRIIELKQGSIDAMAEKTVASAAGVMIAEKTAQEYSERLITEQKETDYKADENTKGIKYDLKTAIEFSSEAIERINESVRDIIPTVRSFSYNAMGHTTATTRVRREIDNKLGLGIEAQRQVLEDMFPGRTMDNLTTKEKGQLTKRIIDDQLSIIEKKAETFYSSIPKQMSRLLVENTGAMKTFSIAFKPKIDPLTKKQDYVHYKDMPVHLPEAYKRSGPPIFDKLPWKEVGAERFIDFLTINHKTGKRLRNEQIETRLNTLYDFYAKSTVTQTGWQLLNNPTYISGLKGAEKSAVEGLKIDAVTSKLKSSLPDAKSWASLNIKKGEDIEWAVKTIDRFAEKYKTIDFDKETWLEVKVRSMIENDAGFRRLDDLIGMADIVVKDMNIELKGVDLKTFQKAASANRILGKLKRKAVKISTWGGWEKIKGEEGINHYIRQTLLDRGVPKDVVNKLDIHIGAEERLKTIDRKTGKPIRAQEYIDFNTSFWELFDPRLTKNWHLSNNQNPLLKGLGGGVYDMATEGSYTHSKTGKKRYHRLSADRLTELTKGIKGTEEKLDFDPLHTKFWDNKDLKDKIDKELAKDIWNDVEFNPDKQLQFTEYITEQYLTSEHVDAKLPWQQRYEETLNANRKYQEHIASKLFDYIELAMASKNPMDAVKAINNVQMYLQLQGSIGNGWVRKTASHTAIPLVRSMKVEDYVSDAIYQSEHEFQAMNFSGNLITNMLNNIGSKETFLENFKPVSANYQQSIIPKALQKYIDNPLRGGRTGSIYEKGGITSDVSAKGNFIIDMAVASRILDLKTGKTYDRLLSDVIGAGEGLKAIKSVRENLIGLNKSLIGSKNAKNLTNAELLKNLYIHDKAIEEGRKRKKEKKGISVWDLDDTLIRSKSGVLYTIPNTSGKPQPGRKVIFLAGGPGGGKSTVVKRLGLEKQGFKIVNQDISLQWLAKNHGLPTDMRDFTKEQASKWGSLTWDARMIAQRKQIKFQGRGDGVIVDGTGSNLRSMEAQIFEFKQKGYDVHMLFVEASLETALARNKARKERSLKDDIVRITWRNVMENKRNYQRKFGENFTEIKTDKLKISDAMPLEAVTKMNNFVSGYKKGRLDSGEFANKGSKLKEKGAEFDFMEFYAVREGKKGPLFDMAMNRIKKFGNKDNFILTARPPQAAPYIKEFLESLGMKIPLENIKGLGNSTAEAKAMWVLEKFSEGYNDFYFADDAIKNVKAVKHVLNQLDVKSKVQQAKASLDISVEFNKIIEDVTGIKEYKKFSGAKAKLMGKNRWAKSIVIPGAQDFMGMMQNFMGRGKKGDAHRKFFEDNLVKPFARGTNDLNYAKERVSNDYKALSKQMPKIRKKLNKKLPDSPFTYSQAVRVHRWTEAGHKIPELSKADIKNLVDVVKNDAELLSFSGQLGKLVKTKDGYVKPGQNWTAETILSDLQKVTQFEGRKKYLAEWIENKNTIFSPENLNKIEATEGTKFREALEDMLYRMETGSNRPRGSNRLANAHMNFINGSVGATMFLNMRSAILQTISATNYINWGENNPIKAALAFANQPQYWKDFSMIWNSDMLRQRRRGLKYNVQEAEIAAAVEGSTNKAKAAIAWLLKKGFTPTQIADSFAISAGGSTFYRNKLKMYKKQGLNEVEAKKKAWLDFQETTEKAQQSSRADLISQQQASTLGRTILAWANTPMQYMRIQEKAARDIINNRGDFKSNVSKIAYYGLIQSVIFASLQSALFAFGLDEEDEKDLGDEKLRERLFRVVNTVADSQLRGIGTPGALLSAIKNTAMEFHKQEEKDYRADHTRTILQLTSYSPVIGSKLRKLYSATQTYQYNKKVIPEIGLSLDNPANLAIANTIEATTNIPVARIVTKIDNIREAADERNQYWQRLAMLFGWARWDVGAEKEEIEQLKELIRERTKKKKKKKKGGYQPKKYKKGYKPKTYSP